MLRSELVTRLHARNPQHSQRDVERVVSVVLDTIAKALADGRRVELRGFGAIAAKTRASRMSRNPRTGEPVAVDQKRTLFFRAGKEVRKRLNGETLRP